MATDTTKFLSIFNTVYKVPKGCERSDEEKEFCKKLHKVQKECGKYFAGKTKCMPWNKQLMYIEFSGKESKATTKRKKHKERSIEALICLVQHPDVIKFWATIRSLYVVVEREISSRLPLQE